MPDEKGIRTDAIEIGQYYVNELDKISELDVKAFESRYIALSKEAFEKLDGYLDSDKGTKDISLRSQIADGVLTKMILGKYKTILEQKGVKVK